MDEFGTMARVGIYAREEVYRVRPLPRWEPGKPA